MQCCLGLEKTHIEFCMEVTIEDMLAIFDVVDGPGAVRRGGEVVCYAYGQWLDGRSWPR